MYFTMYLQYNILNCYNTKFIVPCPQIKLCNEIHNAAKKTALRSA